jgi:L-threonylcarbamoyladenylate synthase
MRAEMDDAASQGKRSGVLALSEDAASFAAAAHVVDLGPADRLDVVGRNLFDGLRSLDDRAVDVIFVRAPERKGLGEAIWDRLYRAAEGRVIDAD